METLECVPKQLYGRFCISAKRRRNVKLLLAICAVVVLSGIFSGLVVVSVKSLYQISSTISSVGTLKAIGIEAYQNTDLTEGVTDITWGTLKPGTSKTYTIYIRNKGNLPVTLSLSTTNWNPSSASNYLTLTWNYDGQTIGVGEAVQVTLTLRVRASIKGIYNFNFDINLVGSE